MLNIDGKEVKIGENFDFQGFEKASSVKNAFRNDKTESLTFSKKGSELKGTLYSKKYVLEQEKTTCEAKMVALLVTIKGNKDGSTEGKTEDITNHIDHALPHAKTSEMSDDQKTAYREYRGEMYKLAVIEDDLKMVQTMIDNLEDNKTYTLSLEQMNTIQKGDLAYEFPSYGEKKIVFSKTGKEIKAKLATKKANYEVAKTTVITKLNNYLKVLKEKGYTPDMASNDEYAVKSASSEGSTPISDSYVRFPYKMYESYGNEQNTEYVTDEACRKAIREYNRCIYTLQGIERDLQIANIMIDNMEDKKKYQLNIKQLATLEKSVEAEVLEGTAANREAFDTVMKSFDDGELMLKGEVVTDKIQAMNIGLIKGDMTTIDFESIKKFYPPWDVYNYDIQGRKVDDQGEEVKAKEASISKAFDELESL